MKLPATAPAPRLDDVISSMARPITTGALATAPSAWRQHQNADVIQDDIGELFHENSKLRRHRAMDSGISAAPFLTGFTVRPSTFVGKSYATRPKVLLPADNVKLKTPLGKAMTERRSARTFRPTPMPLRELGTLLYSGLGITHHRNLTDPAGELIGDQYFRAAPSGGALYPCEGYVLALNVQGLPVACYHYNPFDHALEHLTDLSDADRTLRETFFLHPETVRLDQCGALVILTGVFGRSHAKYGPRAYRYVYQESGHIGQNVALAAQALELGCLPMASVYDDVCEELLDLDGVEESVIYTLAVGKAEPQNPGTPISVAQLRAGAVPWGTSRRNSDRQETRP
jgi:SagB-type dehydrogenase family enzyme